MPRAFGDRPARRIAGRIVVLGALLALMAGPASLAAQRAGNRYDPTFRKYSKRFFGPGFDWRLFKAQGMVESNLDPDAKSWRGARGIMQLMPSTFLEIQTRNPAWTAIDDIELNIAAGIYHDRRLWRQWADSVEPQDHHHFMFASYNAGRGPILRAQNLARTRTLDPRLWATIEAVAPAVRRWRHRETVEYVHKINDAVGRMDSRGRVVRPLGAGSGGS
ncbi:MAG TPA: transglycosylase SLT domain-containing protein [Gemmatimonadales bacterium]|jgi:membrane-bound lytic murein transglycosylase F